MRTLYASGGYSDVVDIDIAGADLTGATYKLALVLETQDAPPVAADAAWKPVSPQAGVLPAELRLLLDPTTPLGHHHVWVQVTIGGRTVPIRLLDDDGLALLVHVV